MDPRARLEEAGVAEARGLPLLVHVVSVVLICIEAHGAALCAMRGGCLSEVWRFMAQEAF